MTEDQFKICPRCNKRVLKEKTVCSHCGAILKERSQQKKKDVSAEEGEVIEDLKKEKICPICGKFPEDGVKCPNCGLENVCSNHIYKFYADQNNDKTGCPKCGPRCAVCGSQTSLVNHNKRAVCSSCLTVLNSSEAAKKQMRTLNTEKIKQALSTWLTFIGLGLGVYITMDPHIQKMMIHLLSLKLAPIILNMIGGGLGLILGSVLSSIIGYFIK
jgi:hypothetical protein